MKKRTKKPSPPPGDQHMTSGPKKISLVKNQYGVFETDKKLGRPTAWYPELNDEMVEYFSSAKVVTEYKQVVRYGKNGEVVEEKNVPFGSPLPTLARFAHSKGFTQEVFDEWVKPENDEKYPGFKRAYRRCKEIQKEKLIEGGMNGVYNSPFTIFVAKNVTDMRDTQDVNFKGSLATADLNEEEKAKLLDLL